MGRQAGCYELSFEINVGAVYIRGGVLTRK